MSQKCTDLCTNNFEINLIGQLPVALKAGSVLSRVALWGWFEEQILTQFLLLFNRYTIRNKSDSVFAQPENVQFEQSCVRWTPDKTASLAVGILFNDNVLILCNYIIGIYINI